MGLSYLAEHLVKELISKEPLTCLKDEARNPVESYVRTENISTGNSISRMAFAKHQLIQLFFYEFLLIALVKVDTKVSAPYPFLPNLQTHMACSLIQSLGKYQVLMSQ